MKNRFGLQNLKIMVLCSIFAAAQSMQLCPMVVVEPIPYRVLTGFNNTIYVKTFGIGALSIAVGFVTYTLTNNKKMAYAITATGLCSFGAVALYRFSLEKVSERKRLTEIARLAEMAQQVALRSQQEAATRVKQLRDRTLLENKRQAEVARIRQRRLEEDVRLAEVVRLAQQEQGQEAAANARASSIMTILAMIPTFDKWRDICYMLRPMREAVAGEPCPLNTPIAIDIFTTLMDKFIQRFAQLKTAPVWFTPLSDENPFYVVKQRAANQEVVYTHSDLHGDVKSLMLFLQELRAKGVVDNNWRVAPGNRVIFLGDYIDRGWYGLETLYTLMILAYNNPESVALVRGNHEDRFTFQMYNNNEIKNKIERFGRNFDVFFEQLDRFFETLPSALYLQKSNGRHILFTHGAHNHEHATLKDFLAADTLFDAVASNRLQHTGYSWSSYSSMLAEGFAPSQRGAGFQYSEHIAIEWMNEHAVDSIIHGHEHTDSCLCDGRVYGLRISPDTDPAIGFRTNSALFSDEQIRKRYDGDTFATILIRDGSATIEIVNAALLHI